MKYLGESFTITDSGLISSSGTTLWIDKNYQTSSLPSFLDGLVIGTLSYELQPGIDLGIDIDQPSTVYLAIHSTSNSDNLTSWLQMNDWSQLQEQEIIYNGENGTEVLNSIWFKELLTSQNLNITFTSEPLTIAVFLKPGKDNS